MTTLWEAHLTAMTEIAGDRSDTEVPTAVFAYLRSMAAQGFKMVGREPTEAMASKGDEWIAGTIMRDGIVLENSVAAWEAMYDAAPTLDTGGSDADNG